MSTLAERVRFLRESIAGLSQRGFGRLCALSPRHIALIEAGDRIEISGETALKIAGATGCPLRWLLSGAGDAPTPLAVRRHVNRRRAA